MINGVGPRRFLGTLMLLSAGLAPCTYAQSSPDQISADSSFILDFSRRLSSHERQLKVQEAQDDISRVNEIAAFALTDRTLTKKLARELSDEAMALSKANNYELGIGLSFLSMTMSCENVDQLDSCSINAITIFRRMDLGNLVALTKLYDAYALLNLGEYHTRVFGLINEFLSDYTIKSDYSSMTIAWNLLGEIYRIIKDDVKAMSCYKKANAYSVIPDGLLYPAPMINIGTLYKNLGKYDSAIYMYEKAIKFDSIGQSSLTAYVANRMAQVLLLQGKYDLAIRHASAADKLYESLQKVDGRVYTLGTLSMINFETNNIPLATQYGEEAVRIAQKFESYPDEILQVYELLTKAFERAGEYEKALYYHKELTEINDRLYGPLVNLEMFNEQMKLELQNQDLEKNLLREKQAVAENEADRQRIILFVVAVFLVMSVAGIIALWRSRQMIQKLNKELTAKNNEISIQAEELKASHNEVEAMNSNLEGIVRERSAKVLQQNKKLTEYAYFNAHRVRGPLARILGLVNILSKELESQQMSDYSKMLRQAGEDLDSSIKEINQILHEEDNGAETTSAPFNSKLED